MTDLITDYERHLRELGRSTRTVEKYTEILRRMERQLPCGLASATTDELRDWIFTDGRGKATRSLYVAAVQSFGRWAADPLDPRLDFDAAALLPRPRPPKGKPKPIPAGQLADILDRGQRPYLLWYVLAAYGGLRCLEIAGLRREHVTASEIWVRGKGDKDRLVPTHRRVWEMIADLPRGPVGTGRWGEPMTARQVSHCGNSSLRRLGHPDVHMHRLRHCFASRAYDATGDLAAVQDLLGHSDPATTRRYVEANRGRMAAAVASLA